MAIRILFALLLVISTTVTVSRQQNIVDTSLIKDGEPFTVTCNAGLVGVTANDIGQLVIHRMLSTQTQESVLAQYLTVGPAANTEDKNVPPGRDWDVTFTDGGNGTNNPDMTITISVSDASCSDAGMYKCVVGYFNPTGQLAVVEKTQNVPSEASAHNMVLSYSPDNSLPSNPYYSEYMVNEILTITCRVDGPQDLQLVWREGWKSNIGPDGDRIYSDYPYANDITTPDPLLQAGSVCEAFRHISYLRMTIDRVYHNDRIFLCVIKEKDQELMSANMTTGIMLTVAGGGGGTPIISTTHPYVTGGINQPVTLRCEVTSASALGDLYWTKDGQRLNTGDSSKYSGGSVSDPSLTIISVSSSDSGSYVCVATNQFGTTPSNNILLQVTYLPQLTVSSSPITARPGDNIVLTCEVDANPAISNFYWSKVGQGIINWASNPSKYSGGTIDARSLQIFNVAASDAGSYICAAVNSIGTNLSNRVSVIVSGSDQQDIVDTSVIRQYTMTCNAGRAGVRANDIAQVFIYKMSSADTHESLLAQYLTYGPQPDRVKENVPPGRHWVVTFTGAGDGSNNPDMTIIISIRDAQCSDAGMYKCVVGYFNPHGKIEIVEKTQPTGSIHGITCGGSGHGAGFALIISVIIGTYFI